MVECQGNVADFSNNGLVLDMERGGSGKVMTEDESSPSLGRRASGGMHRAVLEEEGGPGHQ